MILTLKGANFSTNKIGTLDSWTISKSLRGITCSNSATSIKKDETYSATFTINEGYTMEGVTATVMVGSTSQTLTWSSTEAGGTASVSVKATGNISIVIRANAVGVTYYTLTVNMVDEDRNTIKASITEQIESGTRIDNDDILGFMGLEPTANPEMIVNGKTYVLYSLEPDSGITMDSDKSVTAVFNLESSDPDEPVVPDEPTTATTYYFKDQTTKGYLFGNVVKDSDSSRTTDYIDISGVSQIGYWGRMGYVAGSTYHALEFYDSSKNYLSSLSVLGTGSPMVKNINLTDSEYANVKYVRASVAQSSYTTAQFNTWYFIVGGSASEDNSGSSSSVTDYFPINEYIAADSHTSGNLGDMIDSNGGNAYRTDYIPIAGKSTVNYTGRMGTIGCNYAFYDSNKNVISGLELVGDGTTITTTINLSDSKYANATYIVASISRGSISDAEWNRSYFAIS